MENSAKESTSNVVLIRETASVSELADQAISAVVDGVVDPITAWINISRMEAAIKRFKDNTQVRDISLRELSKYGKKHKFGDCVLEEYEAGTRYDYSMCGDPKLSDMYATRDTMLADIKDREAMLKNLPQSGMVDPETGEIIYPPAKSSRTTIKVTFKNK